MDFLVEALVVAVKLGLAGFVSWLRGECIGAVMTTAAEPRPQSFERVASLVLLALLCTTLAGVV